MVKAGKGHGGGPDFPGESFGLSTKRSAFIGSDGNRDPGGGAYSG